MITTFSFHDSFRMNFSMRTFARSFLSVEYLILSRLRRRRHHHFGGAGAKARDLTQCGSGSSSGGSVTGSDLFTTTLPRKEVKN
jgi:hypothetical protein